MPKRVERASCIPSISASRLDSGRHLADRKHMFGDYLVERGLLSEENLRRALEHQETLSPALGRIGYERGLMSLDQVIEILEAQRQVGLRFGEVAVARGVIDEAQLKELLAVQHDSHLPLGQVLATLGLIDPIVLDRELKAYLELVKKESEIQGTQTAG